MKKYSLFFLIAACSGAGGLHGVGTATPAPALAVAESQRDTLADGAFHADASGHFVADTEARRALEYVFAAAGESDEATLQQRAGAAIAAQLQSPAREEAYAVLQDFVAYRAAASHLKSGGTSLADRVSAVSALRQQFFDAKTRAGFFADDEQRAQIAIAEQFVRTGTTLSAEDKGAQLAALDAQLPAGDVAVRTTALLPVQILRAEASVRAAGDSTDVVHAQRVQAFGEAGAARLAKLDATRANFAAIMSSLRTLRNELAARGSASRDVASTLDAAITAQVPTLEQAHARALLAQ